MASHLRRRSLNLETNGSAAADPRLGVQVPPLTALCTSGPRSLPRASPAPRTGERPGEGNRRPGGHRVGPRPAPQSQVRRWPGSIRVWRWGVRGQSQGSCQRAGPGPAPTAPQAGARLVLALSARCRIGCPGTCSPRSAPPSRPWPPLATLPRWAHCPCHVGGGPRPCPCP